MSNFTKEKLKITTIEDSKITSIDCCQSLGAFVFLIFTVKERTTGIDYEEAVYLLEKYFIEGKKTASECLKYLMDGNVIIFD